MPEFRHGFLSNPKVQEYQSAIGTPGHSEGHSVTSLFAGCGGLDLGLLGGFNVLGRSFVAQPFRIIQAVDNSPDAVEAYRLNLGSEIREADLRTVSVSDLAPATLLTGGFPCQDFSSSGPKTGFDGRRGRLYRVMIEYAEAHQPKIVLGENVPHLARLNKGKYLETILRELEAVGYRCDVWDLYAPDFGVPQSRRRLFIVGVRRDLPGFPVKPCGTFLGGHVSIDEALEDLEAVVDETVTNQSQYFVATRASSGGGQGDHTNKVGEVAYCIRANARGRIQFHYRLDRRLTVRECARLQTFPDEFVFPFSTQRNLTLIGNAVPPMLAHAVGERLADYLQAVDEADADEVAMLQDERVATVLHRAPQTTLFSTEAR